MMFTPHQADAVRRALGRALELAELELAHAAEHLVHLDDARLELAREVLAAHERLVAREVPNGEIAVDQPERVEVEDGLGAGLVPGLGIVATQYQDVVDVDAPAPSRSL